MIKKSNDIHAGSKISEEIINNPFLLLLLQHFQIDVPVHNLNISQLCQLYNINQDLFVAFARLYSGSSSIPELKLEDKEALTIVDFLRTSHRFYSEQIYPEIMELIDEMKQLNDHKEMRLVSVFFSDYFKEVTDHLDYENDVFHSYVIHLVSQLQNKKHVESPDKYSTLIYKDHHDDIEEKLTDLKNLLVKYLPIHKDQIVRRKLFFLLSQLEFDLKIHSEIEELILIPFTMRLEKKLKMIQK